MMSQCPSASGKEMDDGEGNGRKPQLCWSAKEQRWGRGWGHAGTGFPGGLEGKNQPAM